MRSHAPSLVALAACAGIAGAQARPGIIVPDSPSKYLSHANFATLDGGKFYLSTSTVRRVWACWGAKLPHDTTPGKYTFTVTTYDVDPKYGNTNSTVGIDFVVEGTNDEVQGTWTPNTNAAKLNSPSVRNFGLCYDARGQWAVLDWADGPRIAWRPASSLAYTYAPVRITNITTTYVDPAVCYYRGKLMLLWVSGTDIVMDEIDVSQFDRVTGVGTVATVGKGRTIARPIGGKTQTHSPIPIMDDSGEIHGLYLSDRDAANDSDQFLQGSLDATRPHLLVADNTGWLNNGAFFTGTAYYANTLAASGFCLEFHQTELAWLAGHEIPVGGKGSLLAGLRNVNTGPNIMVFYLSDKEIPEVAIPGIKGWLGLNPGNLFFLNALPITDANERAELPIVIPNVPALNGVSLPIQGLGVDPKTAGVDFTFTNTAWLDIKN